jgi:hypothetical protein
MAETYNIYCDESCHLENDNIPVMVLGATWCPKAISGKISRDIRAIKVAHGLKSDFEIKWTKISAAKVGFYLALVDYFFDNPDFNFRGLVMPNKSKLNHEQFGQDHNIFYYKIFYYVIRNILVTGCKYHVYLDIKDTLGIEKIEQLRDTLHSAKYDFDRQSIQSIQHVRSHEVGQVQLTDLFIGALGYLHRGLEGNAGKIAVIDRIKQRSGKTLSLSTLLSESKFNVFIWEAR